MATTATKAASKLENVEHNLDQSVYIVDQDKVKLYPREISNDEIDFDIQTSIRGKQPEDYYLNFRPLAAIQEGFKQIVTGGFTSPAVQVGVKTGEKLAEEYMEFEEELLDPALKLLATRPDVALGFPQGEFTPKDLAETYKPWLDIWRESEAGKSATKVSDRFLAYAPAPIAAIPWFVAEFVPEQLLEFGTKPLNWVGAYGIEKFGPPVLNAALSKLPEKVRATLLKDIFKSEKNLKADFDALGINANAKTSEVVNAYKNAAKFSHPDAGGSGEEFKAINKAYTNIMKSRGGMMNKLFDMFRESKVSKPQVRIAGLLGNQKGSVLIPFDAGDLVKVGDKVGQFISLSGKIATVNLAGKVVEVGLDELSVVQAKESAVNIEKMAIGEVGKQQLKEATDVLGKELTKKGKPLTHEEVIEKSKEADILTQGVSREVTLEFQASLLKTRQHLAALAEENELTPEFLDTLKVMANLGTDIARNLESFKIEALPEYAMVKMKMIKDMQKLGVASEDILKAAKGVDFKDEQQVAKFYRKFVKPKMSEILDEFSYINILSSPKTHIVNIFSNLIQMAGLNPLTKLASGSIDFVASSLTGKERQYYVSEILDFYKGALNAVPDAFKRVGEVMKGKKNIERPDVKHLSTLSKFVDWGTLKVGKYIPRALEAGDVFFRTMIEAGEIEAMSKRLGHIPDEKELANIQKEAKKRAEYYVFRKKPDAQNETGQGKLLSAIDQMTNAIYKLRSVPGFKWFIRFVQTPMNILKQGVEYSPAGFATMPGAKDKTEQAGKAALGSFVFAGGAWLAANNLTTWSAPTSEREKNEFYAAGLQPYSVRIGDKWLSYSKIGPLAYPLAMSAAIHYYTKESPKALSDSEMDKVVDVLTGIMRFFSDQSYMQGLGDILGFIRGEKTRAIMSVPTQLVPLSSLQGWVNQIIDPLQRKAAKGLTIESMIDQIQTKIVGMSQFVPAQIDVEEIPVKKQMRGVNVVSPVKVSKVDQGKLAEYKETQEIKREINLAKKESVE